MQGSIVLCVPSRPLCHKYPIDVALSVYNCIHLKADRSYLLQICDSNRLLCDITLICAPRVDVYYCSVTGTCSSSIPIARDNSSHHSFIIRVIDYVLAGIAVSWGRLMGVLAEGSALSFCNGLSMRAQDRNST